MIEELKGETENIMNQTRVYFNVYKLSEGLYVNEDLCKEYHVGNQEKVKRIKEQDCYLVTEEDLETIKQATKDTSKSLIPNIIKIFDLQIVLSFSVFVDKSHENDLYISDTTCEKYGITPQSKRMLDNMTICKVTEEDIQKIEEQTANEKVKMKRFMIETDLPEEIKPAENLFVLYIDTESDKKYIKRDVYEIAKANEIEIEGIPKIIDDKNCYSITDDELKELDKKTHYRAIEFIVRPKSKTQASNKSEKEEITELVEKYYDTKKRMNLYAHVKTYEDEKVNDDIKPYIDRIMPVLEDDIIKDVINDDIIKSVLGDDDIIRPVLKDDIIKSVLGDDDIIRNVINDDIIRPVWGDDDIIKPVIEEKPIIIYRDKKTGNLYIPTKEEEATTTIMEKPCREISFEEIKSIKRKTVIANVYTSEKKEYKIIICNNNGQLFVSHNDISKLGFYIEKPHRIMVNKEIYEEISPEDIDIIKELESENCHIDIIMKQIAPKRG